MVHGAINIDDSGNPGVESGSDFLSSTRKSWTAVIIPPGIANEASMSLKIFLRGVKDEFGADELHFTDIYSGRNAWKSVPIRKRVEIFELMASIMESFALPVIHQTISTESFNDHTNTLSRIQRAPGSWWDIKDISHFGFLLLCSNVAKYLREMTSEFPKDFQLPLPAFVDEGLAKAGTSIELPNWGDVFEGQRVSFCDSRDNAGVQVADFAAFSISRTQWIISQQVLGEKVSRGDLEFLKTAGRLNVLNLPTFAFSVENLSREGFEFILSRDRKEKGLPRRPSKSPRTN